MTKLVSQLQISVGLCTNLQKTLIKVMSFIRDSCATYL